MDQQDKSGAKFTPGPWVAIPPRLGAAITIYGGDVPIATTCSNTSPATLAMHRRGEVAANARLIAAAPELYEALKSCVAALNPYSDEAKEAYAALAKATGSQQ